MNDNLPGIDAAETVKLSGRVTSGRGLLGKHISRNATVIQNALGATVVEGSLNALLDRPVMFADDSAIRLYFDEGLPRLEWPGKVNDVDIWVHRWQSAPLHIVELLSAVHLRKHFGLSRGDKIQIQVRKCDLKPLSYVNLLTWTMLWFGRKSWEYENDAYCARIQTRWSEKFGATQLGTEKTCADLVTALSKAVINKLPGVRS